MLCRLVDAGKTDVELVLGSGSTVQLEVLKSKVSPEFYSAASRVVKLRGEELSKTDVQRLPVRVTSSASVHQLNSFRPVCYNPEDRHAGWLT